MRILSLACYLGLAPEIAMAATRWSRNPDLLTHIRQGLGLNFLWLLYLLILATGFILESLLGILLSVHFPAATMAIYESMAESGLLQIDVSAAMVPLVLLAFVWVIGIGRALRSSDLPIPFIKKITQNAKALRISAIGGLLSHILVVAGIAIALRGNSLAQPHLGPASVYLLYEEEINVPGWVYAVGLYPVSEISTARWGPGSVIVEPLTRSSIDRAFQDGRLVVMATHGGGIPGTIPLSNSAENYSPADLAAIGGAGADLQFVYIAGCFAGALEGEWKQALAPADVILFNRFSWVFEHVLWMVFKAPLMVSRMS